MQCEVRGVQFRGMARITLKPVLPSFPFVGGFELTWVCLFVNTYKYLIIKIFIYGKL